MTENRKISFIIPARNNLKYLRFAYQALRENCTQKDHEICVADDFSEDGTWQWCQEIMKVDKNFKAIRNEGPTRLGHTILYDTLINEVATNDIVMIYHADMVAALFFDEAILANIKPRTVVSATRIEPPLHPLGVEKVTKDFTSEPETFPMEKFRDYAYGLYLSNAAETTKGIFAPWAIYKEDFQSIGGHDPLYAPQSKEDSDIFNRFLLNGYKLLQARDAFVYHFTCRGSRFNPLLTQVGKNSTEWDTQNYKSSRNFIRKWGSFVRHSEYMLPIVPHKYNVAAHLTGASLEHVGVFEPFFDVTYVDNNALVNKYVAHEQKNTTYDLRERVRNSTDSLYHEKHDILIYFDLKHITPATMDFLMNLSENLDKLIDCNNIEEQLVKEGTVVYEGEGLMPRVEITNVQYYENDLIKLKGE